MNEQTESLLQQLLQALLAQTAAIEHLARSNEAMVDALAQDRVEGVDGDDDVAFYLDGTRAP